MSFTRARALRSLHNSLRHSGLRATPRTSASARTQLAVTKRFASGGGAHGHGEPSSDLPWLFGAIAVTIPACWYLWPTATHAEHHDAHDAHAEESHDDKEEDSKDGEGSEEETDSKDEQKEQKSDDDKEDKSEEKSDDKEDEEEEESDDISNDDSDSKDDSEGSDSKDSGAGGSDKTGVGKGKGKNLTDTRKHESNDSKGASKKRIDSNLAKDLGQGPDFDKEHPDKPARENSATSKNPQKGKVGEITSKQFGLSTTATKHSTQIDQDPEKSTKGEGTPETAKAMGTVSVDRPAK